MRRSILAGLITVVFGVAVGSHAAELTPTDFKAEYVSLDALMHKLADNGLEVIGKHNVAGDSDYTVLVYTAADLKKAAQISGRGFISALRILHNSKDREVVVSNPEYYMRAFLQKEYQEGMAQTIHESLISALGPLTPTEDALKTKKLAKYHFMMSMPYYDDFVRVGKGSTDELLQKLQVNAKDRIVSIQKLNPDATAVVCCVALPPEIERFNQKLETMGQSHLLPYMVLIENGEANILHAKFYLALSFPQLTMTEFMKIMSVPGAIEDSFKADFK